MAGAISDQFKDLFSKVAFAQLATLMPDGSPQVTPVWCDFDGTNVRVNSAKGRVKRQERATRQESRAFGAGPRKPIPLSRHARRGCGDHRGRRRRAHRCAGQKIPGQRQVSVSRAERSSCDLQDQTGKRSHDGVKPWTVRVVPNVLNPVREPAPLPVA